MRLHVLTIGRPKLPFYRDAVAEYEKRLRAFGGVEITAIKAGTREQESAALIARSEGHLRIALDERGELLSSRQLAARLAAWEHERVKSAAFLIGGADGHDDTLRRAARWVWSLSPLTLQHELALTVLLEQLYRARCINAATPYHRD